MAKKLWERVQEDIEKNKQASEQIRINANKQFDEEITRSSEYDTNKHTTRMWDVIQSMKSSGASQERISQYKKANRLTLWDVIKDTANDLGRVGENTWLGGTSGVKQSFNYTYKSGRNHLVSEDRQKAENVATSSKLTNQEKDFFFNLQKNSKNSKKAPGQEKALEMASQKSNNLNNQQDTLLPISKRNQTILPTIASINSKEIDVEKIKKVSETSGFDEIIGKDSEKIAENISQQSNGVTRKLAELAPSIGNMAVGGMASTVNPALGTAYFTMSAAGSYYDDAKQRGMTNEQAQTYAGVMGLMEGVTEELSWNNLSKAGKIAKNIASGGAKSVTKEIVEETGKATLKQMLKDYGIGIGENVIQEALIEPISEATATIVGGEETADWNDIWGRMLQSGIDGGLTAAITGGAELGIQSCVGVVDKINNNQSVAPEELQTAVKEASQKVDVEKMIVDSTNQQINKYKDFNNGKVLDQNSQSWLNKAENIITENNPTNFQQNSLENNLQSIYNGNDLNQVKNVPIEDVMQFKTDGGYRNEQYMTELREDIREKGIKYPIELVRNNDGSIEIENGNHRLQVAKELGLKEVPIKFVESWDSVLGNIDNTENKVIERLEVYNDRNNRNSGKTNILNGGSRTNQEYSSNYRNEFENRRATTGDDRLYNRVQAFDNRSSGTSTFEQNSKELVDASSFSLQQNNNIAPIGENVKRNNRTQKETSITPYRTMEEIANDSNISDIQAFQEATQQLDTPSDRILQQKENELSSEGFEKSPTIDYIKKKRSKEKPTLNQIKDVLAQKFVNKGHYIDKLAKQTNNDKLTWLYDRTMNTFSEAQICIGDYQVNSKGEQVGKSIIDIFEPSQKANLSLEFDDYLLNKHNMSRYAHEKGLYGKEVSSLDSQKIVEHYENKYPEFKEWAKEVSTYNDNNLRDLVDNGMVSKDMYKKLKDMYGDYVPTYRDITDNISQYIDDSVGGNTIKKATQSDKNILSVSESMAEQTLAIKRAIRMNNLGVELYNILGKGGETQTGIDFSDVAMQTLGGDVIEHAKDGTNTFTIFQDGEMTCFKISNELYTAFSKDTLQNKINNNKVLKILLTPSEKLLRVQRELLTTYSIGFSFNNPIKDFQDGLFNSKYGGVTFTKNWTKALYNIGTNGSWYENYKNNGGVANTYFDYNKGILPTKTKNPLKRFGDAIKSVNEVFEQAPRLAEYISTIEHKGSVDEALYNAAEITTNFKRGGDITKAVNKYRANFLNASVQGLDKFYRNISGQRGWKGYANILTKATIYMVAPTIINGLLLGDDEDYEDLPEYIKDDYYLFKTGEGKFFRIPKGRVSSVIGGLARRCLEAGQGKDVDWKSLINTTINQLAPNSPSKNDLIAPIRQSVKNESWYGGEIVSSRLQKLPVAEQYDESTDELSKWIGKKLNISPKKINYVLDQYSGGIGDVLLPTMTPQAENSIIEDKFTTDSVIKNKYVSEYYSKLEELEINKNSQNATDEDRLKYKYMSDISDNLSDLYNQKRKIQNSNSSDKEKKEAVRNIQKQINNIIEERLEKFEDIKTTNLTAKVGDVEYYKYNNEWTRLSDEEKEKNKNISLISYADYKNKVYNLTKKKKDSGEIEKKGQLKNKDKIEVLFDSKGTEKEKEEIYKNYIGTEDKKIQLVDKLNFPLKEYLKYKQQDFENDKDKNGESISGTGKQKVYNYLNSISSSDLSSDYKKIICKIEGINDYDKDVVNFINNYKSITPNERKEVFKVLGYKFDEDGHIITSSILPLRKHVK